MIDRISSLHDDVLVPFVDRESGEYSEYPKRHAPDVQSVIARIEQFGVSIIKVEEALGKRIQDCSAEEYDRILAEAVRARYDVIVASVFDRYMFPKGENPTEDVRLQEMLALVNRFENMGIHSGLNVIKRRGDMEEQSNLVLGLEAGAHLIHTIDDVKQLVHAGVKLFGLQYGKDTPLATAEGLTPFGIKAVKYLFANNLIVDLAHARLGTRTHVLNLAEDIGKGHLVSYTHGSTQEDLVPKWADKMGDRALKQEEVSRIIRLGGIIGLGVTQPFFTSMRAIAERVDQIAQLDGGIQRVALGTDFGGVPPAMMLGINSADDFGKLGEVLSADFGLSDAQIDAVLRGNVKKWIGNAIN